MDLVPITIVKKDSRREPFDREKMLNSIKIACGKRAISIDEIEETVDLIERELRDRNEREIPSKIVGEKIIRLSKTYL